MNDTNVIPGRFNGAGRFDGGRFGVVRHDAPQVEREPVGAGCAACGKPVPTPGAAPGTACGCKAAQPEPPAPPPAPVYTPPAAYAPPSPPARVGAGSALDAAKTWWANRSTAGKVGVVAAGVGVPLALIVFIAATSGDDGAAEEAAAEETAAEEDELADIADGLDELEVQWQADIDRLDRELDRIEAEIDG